ncbi:MAG: M42 family metallopeptidase [bacterium]|jgi:putative aminopeptidase FrvX
MEPQALDFLRSVLEAPSPSGYERPVQEIVRTYASSFADSVTTDVHGNVIAVRNPGAPLRVMLAGHCDQIGFVVQYIDSDGFIWVQPIGGWDPQIVVGQKVVVWTKDGAVPGVIARKAIHMLTEEERKQVVKLKDIWVDIGAKDQADAASRVRIGDPVTLELSYREMLNNRAAAPAMDDKTGLWVAMEALRRTQPQPLQCALFAVSTVQEEIGLRGSRTSAFGIDPHIGVAIDVCHATDMPTVDKKWEADIKLGGGPVIYRGPNMNPRVVEMLIRAAESRSIPYQLAAAGGATGTDANAIQITRAGVAAGLISIPNRYMHSPVEMVSLDDLDRAADLLAAFAVALTGAEDLTP